MSRQPDATTDRFFIEEQGFYPDSQGIPRRSVTSCLQVVPRPWMAAAVAKVMRERIVQEACAEFEQLAKNAGFRDFPDAWLASAFLKGMNDRTMVPASAPGSLKTRPFYAEAWDAEKDLGSAAHALVEWTLLGSEGPSPLNAPECASLSDADAERAQWAADRALVWINDNAEVIGVEEIVHHPGLALAGRCDLFLRLKRRIVAPAIHSTRVKVICEEGGTMALDLKSSKEVRKEMELQAQFYAMARVPAMQGAGVLRLPKTVNDPAEPELRLVDPSRWESNARALAAAAEWADYVFGPAK